MALSALLLLHLSGCTPENQIRADFGLEGGSDDLLVRKEPMAAALRLARAVASGEVVPGDPEVGGSGALDEVCRFEGRRVFLGSYDQGRLRRVSTGKGRNLCESIVAAARDQEGQVATARLKLDVATWAEVARFTPEDLVTSWQDAGLVGFWLPQEGGGEAAFVVPSEVVEGELQKNASGRRDAEALRNVLQTRMGGRGGHLQEGAPMIRFRTESWVEVGSEVARLFRGHAWERPVPEPGLLRERIYSAADYLERVCDARGRFEYGFDPSTGRTDRSYNLVRHAGATYGLLQAYGRTGANRYRIAARRALDHLAGEMRERRLEDGTVAAHVIDNGYSKLGGQGLALLAFATYAEVTGDLRDLPLMWKLARHILSQIHPNGDVVHYFDWGPEGRASEIPVLFYPGEAAVGLQGLHRIDPDPRWLDAAKRILLFILEERDVGLGAEELQHDQWQMIALARLYETDPDDRYRAQAMRIAEAISARQRSRGDPAVAAGYRDYLGSFFNPPDGTHVAARMEGLAAAAALARRAGTGEDEWLVSLVREGIAFSLQIQFVEPRLYFVRMAGRGLGSFPAGLHANFVRIDFTRHNLSALLALEELLEAKTGKTDR